MTAPTNTFVASSAVGIREDLEDLIFRITPTVTPFLNMAAKGKATATLHEWQTQDLAAAATNAQAEGDNISAKAVTATVRLANRLQISTKGVIVSGTMSAVNTAGRKNEMAYQTMLAGLELRRDMEYACMQNTTGASSPRKFKGVPTWIGDNGDFGASGSAGVYTSTDGTAVTDGTQAAFTETRLKNVLQLCFTAGGDPDTIMLPPKAKQTFSTFTGNATRMDKAEDKSLTAAVDVYISDFGELKAVPQRFMRTREVFVLQADKWKVCYLRPLGSKDIAPTGDADQQLLVAEYTVEACAPKANGAVYDIL